MQVQISTFRHAKDPQVVEVQTGDWSSLVASFRTPIQSQTPKADLPLWSPAVFRSGYRLLENVEVVTALVLDVDEDPIPTASDLHKGLEGIQAVVHSSSNAAPSAPRWRAVVALSRQVSKEEYQKLWPAFTSTLPFRVGKSSKDPSRAWFMAKAASTSEYYEVFEIVGEPLDVDVWLKVPAVPEVPKGPDLGTSALPPSFLDQTRSAKLAAAATLLGQAWPSKGRHQAQLALAGALCGQNWAQEDALEFLCNVCSVAGDEDRSKRAQTIRNTWSRADRGDPIAGWTSLAGHVGSSVVSSARELLQRNDIAEIREELRARAPAPTTPSSTTEDPGGLDFLFGAWDTEPPPVEFLVEGLIPRECVAMWFGRADSMKTWLLFSMAEALANGTPWMGRYPTKKSKVGIVDYETGKSNVRRRLFMLRAGANPNLGVTSMTSLKPNQPEFWVKLAGYKFDIVFVDSLRRANSGGDENDSAEAIRPLELAAEFAEETGCAVVYIHHARKEANDGWPEFRGSAAIEDQVDCAFVVRKADITETKKTVEIKCVKPGDMITPEPFAAEVEFDDPKRLATVRVSKMMVAEAAEKEMSDGAVDAAIEMKLRAGPILTVEDLRKAVKLQKPKVTERLKYLKAAGRVVHIPEVGYCIESEEARRERVFKALAESDKWRTEAALAEWASVPTAFVKGMVRDGEICKAGARFIRVEKD